MLWADPLGEVKQRVGQREADGVRLGAGGRGADQAGSVGRQLAVGVDPTLAGGVIEGDRPVLGGEPQRHAHGVADLGESLGVERAAEGEELGALDCDEQVAVGEAICQLGGGQIAKQLIAGDVRDNPDVGLGRAQRVVAHDRLKRLAVPRLTNDRRQCVALAREHLQRLGELGFDHQSALVDWCLRVLIVGWVTDLGDQPLA